MVEVQLLASVLKSELENVAINDVLPLKAARRDANANLKCFGASDTRDLISMVTFTFSMRRHLIRLASAPFISSRSQRLVGFGFRVRVQRVGSTMQNLRRVGKMQVEFEAVCEPTFMTFFHFGTMLETPCSCQTHLTDCLYRFVRRIYAVKVALKLRSLPKKVVFGPPICRGLSLIHI